MTYTWCTPRFASIVAGRFRHTAFAIGVLLPMVSALPQSAFAQSPVPTRIAWKNTRLTGTPDPPPPYTVEKTFARIAWKRPLYLAPLPGTDELLVVLQGGEAGTPAKIVRVKDDPQTDRLAPLLELDRRLIYAVTFHPRFSENGFVYVFSNGPWDDEGQRANRVSRFTLRRPKDRDWECDPGSELAILVWKSAGHDGGDLAFGADGMLYIASGDGTSDSDTRDAGQDVGNLLAALIRIDVDHAADGRPYSVPADNPFVNLAGARPEIWAYGFRNPWRMCIDERSGDIWVGNNGQDQWETAYLVRRGDNFGWSVYEGSHPFYLQRRRGPTPIVPPTIEHPHSQFRSLTGGVVYRGPKLPELDGAYIYGDYSTGKIWGARHRDGKLAWSQELADTTLQIAAFRVDQRGELLIVDHGGGIYRLVPNPPQPNPVAFPTRLSETGLFSSVPRQQPEPGLIPFAVNAPGWADGATAQRWLALPDESRIGYTSSRGWNFDNGTALVQTLSLAPRSGQSSGRPVETRLLVRRQNEWTGYSYRWLDDLSDALLVSSNGDERSLPLTAQAAASSSRWRFPSRTECLACHSRAANYVLGMSEPQMNRDFDYGHGPVNQLRALEQMGALSGPLPKPPEQLTRLVNPYDATQPLDARARSYLHANCSACHVPAGGGNAQLELEITTPPEATRLFEVRPQHDTFNIANAMLVAPGKPDQSVLLHRLSRRGRGQMPPLVSGLVDQQAVALFREWIGQMQPTRTFVQNWTMDDFLPSLAHTSRQRSLASGKAVFRDVGCGQCHRFHGEGGTVGPDLTGLARKQTAQQLLESILQPSKAIADAYANVLLETDDGVILTGRIEKEDDLAIVVRTGPLLAETTTISKRRIRQRSLSPVSNMPEGIVNVLQRDEVLDLLAYLVAEPGQDSPGGD
jgi:uncharacterized repeat protein (TIGR03806 family)